MESMTRAPNVGQNFTTIAAAWRAFCAREHKYVDADTPLAILIFAAVADPAEHYTGDLILDAVTVLRSTAEQWKARHDTCDSIGGAEIASIILRLDALDELRRREREQGGAS